MSNGPIMPDAELTIEEIRNRYVELILGPAGLDELSIALTTRLLPTGGEEDELHEALRQRIQGAGGFALPLRGRPVPARPRPPSDLPLASSVVLKTPELAAAAVRVDPADALDESGRWPTRQVVVPRPTPEWAQRIWPDDRAAIERLWRALAFACRLDSDDPDAEWHNRHHQLARRASILESLDLDRLHFSDPDTGTDLTVGLLPGSSWQNGRASTVRDFSFVPIIPCEEIFTAPDPTRIDGVAVASRPLGLGELDADGIRAEFKPGEDARVTADRGQSELVGLLDARGGLRLGEVAPVDRESRLGQREIPTFYDTLLDENAACHIAFGGSIPGSYAPDERELANRAALHIDIVIGTPRTVVTGYTCAGGEIPILDAGAWQRDLQLQERQQPARIPEVVAAFKEAWQRDPDLRLGQFYGALCVSDFAWETTADEDVLAGLKAQAARPGPDGAVLGRDPARIPQVLAALEARWLGEPELRLGQLLRQCARRAGCTTPGHYSLVEDNHWIGALSR